jgi:hypothetical protein
VKLENNKPNKPDTPNKPNKPKEIKTHNTKSLNEERIETFRNINLQMFEDLAKKKGVTLEQLLSAGIKAYLEKDENEKENKK